MFRYLFRSLVRPHLEYATPVWAPQTKKLVKMIENVQRRATNKIAQIKHLTYPERLEILDMPTLAYRRARADMIETFKILNPTVGYDAKTTKGLLLLKQGKTRGHDFKLYPKRSRINLRKNFFTQRVVNEWNCLPDWVVSATDTTIFKKRLDQAWKVKPLLRHYDK